MGCQFVAIALLNVLMSFPQYLIKFLSQKIGYIFNTLKSGSLIICPQRTKKIKFQKF
jgi:hypothetical protein